jgi:peptidoglycan/LPS O-acetylase OafA/YrhL
VTREAKLPYRIEIDGLRGIAVAAVVVFHAQFGCPGGYVGVDVFFVISGFLITSLLWKDLASGRFSFPRFWERRARRIVPAMAALTLSTLVAGWLWLLPTDLKDLGRAAASQAVFGANIYYWQESGYFGRAAEDKTLLHTWSLAVEEQFYVVAPILLWAVARIFVSRSRQAVLTTLLGSFALSIVLSIFAVARHPEAAFYLLPTRAWELLLGALLVFVPSNLPNSGSRFLREAVGTIGLALILIPILLYSSATPFPGLAAIPPCLGTALVILATGVRRETPTAVARMLSNRPLVFIGLISYSLYLWHWPVITFGRYAALRPLSVGNRTLLVGLGFLLATVSWRYVETPFRTRRLASSRRSMFSAAGGALAIIFTCGMVCVVAQGFPRRVPEEAMRLANAASDKAFVNELTADDIRAGRLPLIGATNTNSRPLALVWGDSYAMAAMPGIDDFLREQGATGRAATHSCTAPVLGWFARARCGLGPESLAYSDAVVSYVEAQRIRHVILVCRWKGYLGREGEYAQQFEAALLTTITKLVSIGAVPWLVLEVPDQDFDVPRALSRASLTHLDISSLCARPLKGDGTFSPAFLSTAEAAGCHVLDPKPSFLDSTGTHYIVTKGAVVLYRDHHHLTTRGAKLMLLPLLRSALSLKMK